MRAAEMRDDSSARIGFHGFRSDVDKFFSKRMLEPNAPCPLKQEMPTRLLEIIDWLTADTKSGRSELSSYLLDLAGDWRTKLAIGIEDELRDQPANKRPKPFSTYGNVRLTIFCYGAPMVTRNAALALDHTRAVMLVSEDNDRVLLELSYSEAGKLLEANWQKVDLKGLSDGKMTELRKGAERLRETRIANAKKIVGKIGRNERCPCGSGKKFKKCCINK
jgi:hypothetical protein